MTVKDYCNIWNEPAYIFYNYNKQRHMYFIPICEYDSVEIEPTFDVYSYCNIVKDGEVVCSLKNVINASFIDGDAHFFIVPIEFDKKHIPEENIVYPDEDS